MVVLISALSYHLDAADVGDNLMKIAHALSFMKHADKLSRLFDSEMDKYTSHAMSTSLKVMLTGAPTKSLRRCVEDLHEAVESKGWESISVDSKMKDFETELDAAHKKMHTRLLMEEMRRILELEMCHISDRERGRSVGSFSLAARVEKMLNGQPSMVSEMHDLIKLMIKQKNNTQSMKLEKRVESAKKRLGY